MTWLCYQRLKLESSSLSSLSPKSPNFRYQSSSTCSLFCLPPPPTPGDSLRASCSSSPRQFLFLLMASTPPHCSITTTTKPYPNNNPYPQNHLKNHRRSPHRPWAPLNRGRGSTASPSSSASSSSTAQLSQTPVRFPALSPLQPPKSDLSPDFSGRRSTRFVSKMHFGRPKTSMGTRHSLVAEDALHHAVQFSGDDVKFRTLLLSFESKLCGSDDYIYILRELGNRGEFEKAVGFYEFGVRRERRKNEQGKLASAMISTLGRLGKVGIAKRVFETALADGYGSTVYAFSAIISAYGRSGYYEDAIKVFSSMKSYGLRPNLVTYNAVIDACGKGGMEFKQVAEFFDEMQRNGVQPDRITFNSLLAVCSRGGSWEAARNLFDEMLNRGLEQDIFTYNTLLDALCKGGQMDLAFEVLAQMPARNIMPNVVTYSTVIDGYAKAGRLSDALTLFGEMKYLGIPLDRVSYNTLLSIYAKLGRFEEALDIVKEMAYAGIRKDAVTYNALLGGYGKQGKYDEVKSVFAEMKKEHVLPNILTYSTLIDVYSKGGLYKEAMEIFREFKSVGLRADVVLYSALIDALCKNGLVESAVSLLDEMTKEGISPNVVTYNSMIDAFGRPTTMECLAEINEGGASDLEENESFSLSSASLSPSSSLSMAVRKVDSLSKLSGTDDHQSVKIFGQLVTEGNNRIKKDFKQELSCILEVFHKMHELEIKPNVVTFSAILNACSRCNSFEEAKMLLEELRLFDNKVYGVTHGLLMGNRESVWDQAQSLFDEVKAMDGSTASAFYNALTDMLWHFNQKRGAQMVVLEGRRRKVWENVWSDSCLDLHLMSSGAARAMVHAWLLNIHSIVYKGHELPDILSILTGWGKHSKVMGDGALRPAVDALLRGIGAPFHVAKSNVGRFISSGSLVAAWLKKAGTLEDLVLHDHKHEQTTSLPLPL